MKGMGKWSNGVMERGEVGPSTPALQHSNPTKEVYHAGHDESGADLRL